MLWVLSLDGIQAAEPRSIRLNGQTETVQTFRQASSRHGRAAMTANALTRVLSSPLDAPAGRICECNIEGKKRGCDIVFSSRAIPLGRRTSSFATYRRTTCRGSDVSCFFFLLSFCALLLIIRWTSRIFSMRFVYQDTVSLYQVLIEIARRISLRLKQINLRGCSLCIRCVIW